MWNILAIASVHISSSGINAIVKYYKHLPHFALIFAQLFFCALLFLPYAIYERRALAKIDWRQYIARGLVRYMAIFFVYLAYKRLSMQVNSVVGMTQPFFVLVLAILLGQESLSIYKLFWLLVGYAGACFSVAGGGYGTIDLVGVGASVAGNLCAAISVLMGKYMSQADGPFLSTVGIALIMPVVSGVGLFLSGNLDQVALLSGNDLAGMCLLGAVGAFHVGIFQVSIRNASSSFVSSFQYIKIPLAVMIDRFFGHPIEPHSLLATVCILVSLSFLSRQSTNSVST